MADFTPIIRDAYREILQREPDAGGLSHDGGLMDAGLSEARLREAPLRSPEYTQRNPEAGLRDRLPLNVHIPTESVLDDVADGLGLRWVRVDFGCLRMQPARDNPRVSDPPTSTAYWTDFVERVSAPTRATSSATTGTWWRFWKRGPGWTVEATEGSAS